MKRKLTREEVIVAEKWLKWAWHTGVSGHAIAAKCATDMLRELDSCEKEKHANAHIFSLLCPHCAGRTEYTELHDGRYHTKPGVDPGWENERCYAERLRDLLGSAKPAKPNEPQFHRDKSGRILCVCGEPAASSKHIKYGPGEDNPRKHVFDAAILDAAKPARLPGELKTAKATDVVGTLGSEGYMIIQHKPVKPKRKRG